MHKNTFSSSKYSFLIQIHWNTVQNSAIWTTPWYIELNRAGAFFLFLFFVWFGLVTLAVLHLVCWILT